MATQRPIGNSIIGSGIQDGTERNDDGVISSASAPAPAPQIISSTLTNEVILNGTKYVIEKQVARSGESEVFLVDNNGSQFIFKYYYSQYKPKDEIVSKLKGLKHPDIIALLDYGYLHDRFFELSEYAMGGTLQDIVPVTSAAKIKEIVAETIEALSYCHSHGIIHRDIKPENIFYRTADKKDIAIGDFGIASNVKEGEELVRTSLARTSLYAAPELFTQIQGKTTIEKSVDYYALGMTVLYLWHGHNPFDDIDEYSIMRFKSEGRVSFPDDIDDGVEKLIKGLITVNPRDRWSYGEVKRWLQGEDVVVHYETVHLEYKPYPFGTIDGEQIVAHDPQELAHYLEKYPDRGTGHLYRNTIAKWIEDADPGLFNELMDIVENEFPGNKPAGLAKAIYILDQDKSFTGFDGTKLKTQEDIAAYFERNFGYYIDDLENPHAAFYVFLEARNYKQKADEYRGYFQAHNAELALNRLIFTLQGADKFIIDSYTIYQPEQLLQVDDATLPKIVPQLSNVNSKLSLWIAGFAYLQSTIDKWRILQKCDETTLRYALQQGFACNGRVARNVEELKKIFEEDITLFLEDHFTPENNAAAQVGSPKAVNAEKLRDDADYWLRNYMGASFYQMVLDSIKSKEYSTTDFTTILEYLTMDWSDHSTDMYEVIESILSLAAKRTSDKDKIQQEMGSIILSTIQFRNDKEKLPFERLKKFVQFAEKHPDVTKVSLAPFTNSIATGIRMEIDAYKGEKDKVKSHRAELKSIMERLEKLDPDLPVVKRFQYENKVIDKVLKDISHKNQQEKQSKVAGTQREFGGMLDKHREKYKDETARGYNSKTNWCAVGCIASILLLIWSIVQPADMFGFFIFLFVVSVPIMGGIIGVIMGFRTNDKKYIEPEYLLWGAFIGLIIGGIMGYFLNRSLPIIAIQVILVSAVIGSVFYIRQLIKLRSENIDAIELDNDEKSALAQSLNNINTHFAQKESAEAFDETVRILLLDEQQFAREFPNIGQPENPPALSSTPVEAAA